MIGVVHAASREEVLPILQLADYIGVDYPECVLDGNVLNEAEYAEQLEFSADVVRRIVALPESAGKSSLVDQARALQAAVTDKAQGQRIQNLTAQMIKTLLTHYPITITPARAPDLRLGSQLYQMHCASCHGSEGRGDGPAAAALEPRPTDFHDLARRNQRSLLSYYNTVTLGVPGTAMASYSQLSEVERWALVFHIAQLAYTPADRQAGAALWTEDSSARQIIPDMSALVQLTPNELSAADPQRATALLAGVLADPALLEPRREQAFVMARKQLEVVRNAYAGGDREAAGRAALSAYLDGFELAEATLAASDAELMRRIEAEMMALRNAVRDGEDISILASRIDALQALLDQAEAKIDAGQGSAAAAFSGSFLILFREGLEAILVLAAMFAFLKKSDRTDGLVYLHVGWISALLLGFATWFAATYLIDISGASREVTEGLTALLAMVILVGVGLWLHNKSYASRWQQYIAGQMQAAMGRGGLRAIGLVSFLSVYREAFETVLFYRALWSQGQHPAMLAGMGIALLLLGIIAVALFRFSVRLPIRQFFSFSAALIAVLAVIFAGQGVSALQAAGWIGSESVRFIHIPMLGIYPTVQTLSMQGLVVLLIMGGMAYNHWAPSRLTPAKSP
ncbi:MAG TPA: cytochrome c/FTR1 family iron permease [Candidatus Acidoferrales bacterium]|nr:cytochrome c/FTR1 family iron permease [Candidatus Acidoferrales bacterium]